jgi:transaldolase
MKIKIFADGADVKDMVKVYKEGIVTGFTTNPTLMKKSGITDYEKFAKEVLKEITDLPISFEVFSDDFESMEREALIINSWGKNVNVKIPITNTKGESSFPLILKLLQQGIKINITAILTMRQIDEIANVLPTDSDVIISIFAGRIADTGIDPIQTMKYAFRKFILFNNVRILWASTRELLNIIQAEECECDIITVTNDILKKLLMIGKDLTELSLETVLMFYNDAKSSGFKI